MIATRDLRTCFLGGLGPGSSKRNWFRSLMACARIRTFRRQSEIVFVETPHLFAISTMVSMPRSRRRLAVAFHRLHMPDGFSVSLDHFKGLNQIGDAGLRDQVNNHYLRIFGVSLAIGVLGAVAEAGTGSAITASGTDLMRQGLAGSMAQSASQILDKFLNILPTVTIREGHRVKVYLSGDLALPDYNNHKMPSDL